MAGSDWLAAWQQVGHVDCALMENPRCVQKDVLDGESVYFVLCCRSLIYDTVVFSDIGANWHSFVFPS
jgi:hypothetical protein